MDYASPSVGDGVDVRELLISAGPDDPFVAPEGNGDIPPLSAVINFENSAL